MQRLPPSAFRENRTSQLRQSHTTVTTEDKLSSWQMAKFSKAVCYVFVFWCYSTVFLHSSNLGFRFDSCSQ